MGDYLNLKNGDQVKIGTCGDNRYMRREEAERYRTLDEGNQIEGNLNCLEALWRFPFLKEDGSTLGQIAERNMFDTLTFTVPKEFLPKDHGEICVHIKAEGGGYGINRLIPCPLSSEDKLYGANVASPVINIYGERYDKEGNARTIFRCGYCGQPFSLDAEEIEIYKQAFIKYHTWGELVANRLKPQVPEPVTTS